MKQGFFAIYCKVERFVCVQETRKAIVLKFSWPATVENLTLMGNKPFFVIDLKVEWLVKQGKILS